VLGNRPTTLWLRKGPFLLGFGRGGGGRTRPPNYKVPWNEGVAAAHQIQLLILLIDRVCAGLAHEVKDGSFGNSPCNFCCGARMRRNA
jgi:hypothetical protein